MEVAAAIAVPLAVLSARVLWAVGLVSEIAALIAYCSNSLTLLTYVCLVGIWCFEYKC